MVTEKEVTPEAAKAGRNCHIIPKGRPDPEQLEDGKTPVSLLSNGYTLVIYTNIDIKHTTRVCFFNYDTIKIFFNPIDISKRLVYNLP